MSDGVVLPDGWGPVLDRLARREISPAIALLQMALLDSATDPVPLLARLLSANPGWGGLAELSELAASRRPQLERVRALIAEGVDPGTDGALDEQVGATRALFERLAERAPEAGIALYALGDPALLGEATRELVEVIRRWTPFDGLDVLDFGCGIGRLMEAIAPRARHVTGVDLAPAMLAEARRRLAGAANVRLEVTDGHGLGFLGRACYDLVLAVDSFPYLARPDGALIRSHLLDIARLLRPGGDLLVFNWSYRGDVAADVAEAGRLAAETGFELLRAGERPFALWDGVGFQLRRLR